MSEPARG